MTIISIIVEISSSFEMFMEDISCLSDVEGL